VERHTSPTKRGMPRIIRWRGAGIITVRKTGDLRATESAGWMERIATWNRKSPTRSRRETAPEGEGIGVTVQTLGRRLHERELLLSVDKTRETLKLRRRLQGSTHDVWHIDADILQGGVSAAKPDKPDISENSGSAGESCAEPQEDCEPPSSVNEESPHGSCERATPELSSADSYAGVKDTLQQYGWPSSRVQPLIDALQRTKATVVDINPEFLDYRPRADATLRSYRDGRPSIRI
jgi:hypothetical protein